MFTWFI